VSDQHCSVLIMFESITATAVVENALSVVQFLRVHEANVVAQMWHEYPWLMLAGASIGAYALWKRISAPACGR